MAHANMDNFTGGRRSLTLEHEQRFKHDLTLLSSKGLRHDEIPQPPLRGAAHGRRARPPVLRSLSGHDPYAPIAPPPPMHGLTSPAAALARGKTPDLRSVSLDTALSPTARKTLELLSRSELAAWHVSLQNEAQSFNSLAIYGELRLREALLLETDGAEFYANAPHTVVAALAGDLLLKLTTLYRRFASFTELLAVTTLRCVFSDYERTIAPTMEATGGRATAAVLNAATPWFEVCAQLRARLETYAEGCRRNRRVVGRGWSRWRRETLRFILRGVRRDLKHKRAMFRSKMKLYMWGWHCAAMKSVRYRSGQNENYARRAGGGRPQARASRVEGTETDVEKSKRLRLNRERKDYAFDEILDDVAEADALPEDPVEAKEATEARLKAAFDAGYEVGLMEIKGPKPPEKKGGLCPKCGGKARPAAAAAAGGGLAGAESAAEALKNGGLGGPLRKASMRALRREASDSEEYSDDGGGAETAIAARRAGGVRATLAAKKMARAKRSEHGGRREGVGAGGVAVHVAAYDFSRLAPPPPRGEGEDLATYAAKLAARRDGEDDAAFATRTAALGLWTRREGEDDAAYEARLADGARREGEDDAGYRTRMEASYAAYGRELRAGRARASAETQTDVTIAGLAAAEKETASQSSRLIQATSKLEKTASRLAALEGVGADADGGDGPDGKRRPSTKARGARAGKRERASRDFGKDRRRARLKRSGRSASMEGISRRSRELLELGIAPGGAAPGAEADAEGGGGGASLPVHVALQLIPTLLEEALRADSSAASAEADAAGRRNVAAMIVAAMANEQLPLRTLAMNCLIRRFGVRTLAVKKLRAIVTTCLDAKTRSKHPRLALFAVLLGILPGDAAALAPESEDHLEAADLRSLGMLVRRYFQNYYAGLRISGDGAVPAPTALARLLLGKNRQAFEAPTFLKAAGEMVFHRMHREDPAGYVERVTRLEALVELDEKLPKKPGTIDADEALALCVGFARYERVFEKRAARNGIAATNIQCAWRRAAQRDRERSLSLRAWTEFFDARPRYGGGENVRDAVDLDCFRAILRAADASGDPARTLEYFKDFGESAELMAEEERSARIARNERTQKALVIQAVVQGHFARKADAAGQPKAEFAERAAKAQIAVALSRWQALFHAADLSFFADFDLSEDKEIHLARMLEGARGEALNRAAFLDVVVDKHELTVGSATREHNMAKAAEVRVALKAKKKRLSSRGSRGSHRFLEEEDPEEYARRYSSAAETVRARIDAS